MLPGRYTDIKEGVVAADFGHDIEWSETIRPPGYSSAFATEAIFIISNSGMKWQIARQIFDRVMPLVRAGRSARDGFGHAGKAGAIHRIWRERNDIFARYMALEPDPARLHFLGELPWIGKITKYHLAKNLGVDCAKPDCWLERLCESRRQIGPQKRPDDLVVAE
ncbi:hypothetical protein [Roseovarius sp. ZX-A-9]|uniref:hypothetical protein n=1 Tax=Roseovarius sp. ZX-A-9 TaxID=3014783 RepID=UPI00232C66A2|nr:hypothetical protein [Roseovarius sp. ZX-A-9]